MSVPTIQDAFLRHAKGKFALVLVFDDGLERAQEISVADFVGWRDDEGLRVETGEES